MVEQLMSPQCPHPGISRQCETAFLGATLTNMIRRESRWQVGPSLLYTGSVRTSKGTAEYKGDSNVVPRKCYPPVGGRWVWVYRRVVYSTVEDLDATAVEALILASEDRVKARVARVKARTAQGSTLDADAGQRRAPIPDIVKVFVWRRDGGKCVKCGSTRNLEYDHDIPLSLGGSNTARNLRLLCETCNRRKGASLI